MYEYSKEGDAVKRAFLKIFNPWLETHDFSKGGITKDRVLRGVNSLIALPDGANPSNNSKGATLDYVDNALRKGLKVQSIMGALGSRVQKSTSGGDADKARLAVTPMDSMHHIRPLDTYGPSLRVQSGSTRRDFLKQSADNGIGFAETDLNLGGQSLHGKAHTGDTGASKRGKLFAGLGESGERALSAHRRGTKDPTPLAVKEFSSGSEMFEAAKPHFEVNAQDAAIGRAADAPRQRAVTRLAIDHGVIPEGVDPYAKGTDPKLIKKVQDFYRKNEALLRETEKAFDPKEARALIKKLAGASLLGVGMLGTAADAAETGMRTKLAIESKNPVDALQAAISGAATAVGATGVGEVLGIPLEVVNVLIDQHRSGGASKIRGRSGAKRAKMKASRKP